MFHTKKFHWKSKERKKLVIPNSCVIPTQLLTLSHPKRNSFPLGNGRSVTISRSLTWIDCIKTFPIKFTMSVILLSNSLFYNSPSVGDEEGRPLFQPSPSKLQSSVPDHYSVTWVRIVVSSTGQQGLVPASLSKRTMFTTMALTGDGAFNWSRNCLICIFKQANKQKLAPKSSVGWVVKGWLQCQFHSNHQEKSSPKGKEGVQFPSFSWLPF